MPWPLIRFQIEGNSMSPTLKHGDKVFVSRLARFKLGDIMVFSKNGLTMVKRIMARENNSWVVRGDNFSESTDSLDFGNILPEQTIGKVLFKYG